MSSDISARPGTAYLHAPRPHVPWTDTSVAGADGTSIRLRIYEPAAQASATLVWAHGGSWTRGSIEGWHGGCEALAAAGTARIISVGYRLAPRWPHPTAVMDIASATLWAQREYRHRTFVGGDSAGGTLAGSAALWFRDSGLPLGGQILAYPPLDPDCAASSYRQAGQPFPPRTLLLDSWREYAGSGEDLRDRLYLSPLHAPALKGLCPTSLIAGTTDPVRDDVEQFAARLTAASVPVNLLLSPSIAHGQFLDTSPYRSNPVHEWIQSRVNALSDHPKRGTE